jgi:ABC transport system ATP-binding/permease protein
MAPPLLLLQDIRLSFGGTPLLAGVDLSVSPGERLCLVGRNGSGKSTLLKIAAGQLEADGGERFVQPDATIRFLPQEPDLAGYSTCLAYVEAGLGPDGDDYRARYLLERLGLTGEEDPTRLSGGEARRAALARVLAPAPDVLLLDEPTNHLDLPAIEWLESELADSKSALVLISHDRRFLQTLSRSVVWLDRGVSRRLDRGFAEFEAWRDGVLDEEEAARHKLDRKIVMEEHWVRYGVTARRKRNQKRLSLLHGMRRERREQRRAAGVVKLTPTEGENSGRLVIEAEGIGKSYGDLTVVKDFTTRILRGDRLGIVGANGAGKTTLLNLLIGELAPDVGSIRLGSNLAIATLDQQRRSLDPQSTLAETLTGGRGDTVSINGKPKHVIGYMKDFLFGPEQARTPVGALSGGERGRLALACALAKPSNLLVLDEPTNDLDLETLDLLQEMLADYAGTVLLISHDRDFLDRVVTSVLVAEGGGRWLDYAGGYTDMVTQRGSGIAAKSLAAIPKEAAAKTPSTPVRASRNRKLTFRDKHALETLPVKIEALHAEITRYRHILADSGLYARDRTAFDRASNALSAANAELAASEERWLALEMLREELER